MNQMKISLIVSSIALVFILITGFQEDVYIPSDGIIWNEDLQEYYYSEIVTWDPDMQQYNLVERDLERTPPVNDVYLSDDGVALWLDAHRNSDNLVEQLIVEYYDTYYDYQKKEAEEYDAAAGYVGASNFRSSLTFNSDVLDKIRGLDLQYLPELLSYVDANQPLSTVMPFAIESMMRSKIPSLGKHNSPVYFDYDQWHYCFENRFTEAEAAIREVAGQFLPASGTDVESVISEYGVFALPAIYDQINNGNTTLAPYLELALPLCYEDEITSNQGVASDIQVYAEDVSLLKAYTKK